ncbi:methyltransferase type 11 [Sulfobacillus sp. hq2]|nr:methyltransferase type 11 [Sulfobacillus sp. hq2]
MSFCEQNQKVQVEQIHLGETRVHCGMHILHGHRVYPSCVECPSACIIEQTPYRGEFTIMNESNQKIRDFFSQHHHDYQQSAAHARGADLRELLTQLAMATGAQILDAACGTGHTALAAAAQGYKVTGLDLTPAMLEEGRAVAKQQGLAVEWVVGDVHHLPWPEGTFDAVTCRRAAHHFRDLPKFLQECLRVLRAGGHLGISDMTAPSHAVADLNEIERLRDTSHWAARSANEWAQLLADVGFDLIYLRVSEEVMSPQQWLSPVLPESQPGHAALQRLESPDLAPGIVVKGQFIKYRLVAVAKKP